MTRALVTVSAGAYLLAALMYGVGFYPIAYLLGLRRPFAYHARAVGWGAVALVAAATLLDGFAR